MFKTYTKSKYFEEKVKKKKVVSKKRKKNVQKIIERKEFGNSGRKNMNKISKTNRLIKTPE